MNVRSGTSRARVCRCVDILRGLREARGSDIVWINGAFGRGKTTLAEALHWRLPDAMSFDPEYVGYILRMWVPAPDSGDFQDIPLWRKLVADFAVSLSAEYAGR